MIDDGTSGACRAGDPHSVLISVVSVDHVGRIFGRNETSYRLTRTS